LVGGGHFWPAAWPIPVISGPDALAFTVAPHLQIINYRSGFSRFVGI
jgi:hypothetical protein